jgi:hypothetical protein
MRVPNIRARVLAVIAGIALFFFVAFVSELWSKTSSLILFTFFVATYGLVGFVFGFVWPSSGWRLGLYLFSIWPPVLALETVFAWGQPITDVKGTLLDLVGYLLILIGSCVGGWIGAVIGQRVGRNGPASNEQALSSS